MTRTDGLVVRVEQVPEVAIESVVAGERGLEEKGLEEPSRMTAVPLGRAHVGHGLNDLVLRTKRSGERLGEVAYAANARSSLPARRPSRIGRSGIVCGAVIRRAIRNRRRPMPRYVRELPTPLRRSSCSPLYVERTFDAPCCPGLLIENTAPSDLRIPGRIRGGIPCDRERVCDQEHSRRKAETREFHAAGCSK